MADTPEENQPKQPRENKNSLEKGCFSAIWLFLFTLILPMLIGITLIFFVESNLFYGGICGILSLVLGLSIASFYAFTGVVWHAIKCIFTLQFSKIFRKIDELENSSQEKIGKKYGWIFILSSLFVYLATAYFFMSDQNSDLVYYGVAGIVQGSLFWFAFTKGYINFAELT